MTLAAKVLTTKPTWDGHLQLDARVSSLQHRELMQLIHDSVERTQRPFLQPLPDQLIITQTQLVTLNNFTEAMADSVDRIMITPWNVMEVIVDDQHVGDHEAVQQTLAWVDEANELEEAQREQRNTETDDNIDPRSVPGRNGDRRPAEVGKRAIRLD